MDALTKETLLEQITSSIEDQTLPLTYKTVSRQFSINVQEARQLLAEYVSSRRSKFAGNLFVVYALYGNLKKEDGSLENTVAVVSEDVADEWELKMVDCVKEVYSVHAFQMDDSLTLRMIDNPCSVEHVKVMREVSLIRSPGIYLREAGERMHVKTEMAPRTVKSIETEEKKIMAGFGQAIEALRVKSEPSDPVPAAPPKSKETKGSIASWVKAGGLDPKKADTDGLKEILDEKQRAPSPKKSVDNEDSDDDMFSARKPRRPTIDDSSDSDAPVQSTDLSRLNVEAAGNRSANKTMHFDEESDGAKSDHDKPTIIRRKSKKVSEDVDEEDGKAGKKKDGAGAHTFGKFTSVSDEDTGSEEQEEPKPKTSSKRPAKPKAGKKSTGTEEPEEDEAAEVPKKKRVTKKTTRNAAESDEEDAAEQPNKKTAPRKTKPESSRKRKQKGSDEENSGGERSRVSPEIQKPEPLRPFLKSTPQDTTSKRKKPVMVKRIDDEGYTVTEMVWKEVSDGEEEDAVDITKSPVEPERNASLKSEARGSPSTSASDKSTTKKDTVAAGKKQSSIMSFFKKA